MQGTVTLRVRTVLQERGRLTNAALRHLTGYSRPAVIRLMAALREQGIARLEGKGRGAAWIRGPKVPPPKDRAARRK